MAHRSHAEVGQEPAELTPTEWVVLRHTALGLTDYATAQDLGCSRYTVRNHLTSAYHKLNVGNRIEAFRKLGWMVVPDE